VDEYDDAITDLDDAETYDLASKVVRARADADVEPDRVLAGRDGGTPEISKHGLHTTFGLVDRPDAGPAGVIADQFPDASAETARGLTTERHDEAVLRLGMEQAGYEDAGEFVADAREAPGHPTMESKVAARYENVGGNRITDFLQALANGGSVKQSSTSYERFERDESELGEFARRLKPDPEPRTEETDHAVEQGSVDL
jgi:hypothetical protein